MWGPSPVSFRYVRGPRDHERPICMSLWRSLRRIHVEEMTTSFGHLVPHARPHDDFYHPLKVSQKHGNLSILLLRHAIFDQNLVWKISMNFLASHVYHRVNVHFCQNMELVIYTYISIYIYKYLYIFYKKLYLVVTFYHLK